jgi:hypothetical protein
MTDEAMRLNGGESWRLAAMMRLRDRGTTTGWPVELTDVLGDDEKSLAAVRFWGQR